MSKHTPEPWRVGPYGGIYSVSEGYILLHGLTKSGPMRNRQADEARAVVCVNACAGLNPAAVGKAIETLRRLVINHDPDWPTTPAERDRAWEQASSILKELES